ncbi:MAG: UbiX family flavin prenyltransferase [Bacteroidales bacterium]|nr:UbiX family flavin prenyltransferase [Bacteroidales bacterium]
MEKTDRKIIVAVTGASGMIYAKLLIERLSQMIIAPGEIAVVFSDTARRIWLEETDEEYRPVSPAKLYENDNFFAPFASGSSEYDTMIICPASMGMLSRIANGISGDLTARSADVMLKERRKLIVVPREAPYNLIHIRNMEQLTLAGAIICPASPSFYSHPATIDELVMTVVERIIVLSGFKADTYRWMVDDR